MKQGKPPRRKKFPKGKLLSEGHMSIAICYIKTFEKHILRKSKPQKYTGKDERHSASQSTVSDNRKLFEKKCMFYKKIDDAPDMR